MARSRAVISLYDEPMWHSIGTENWQLQQCSNCHEYRYPPAPICPHCLSMDYAWQPLSGRGTILSWVVFHRQYFPDYPAPYNNVAVQLAEGPIIISNLVGELPVGSWIGCGVEICYERDAEGETIPRVKLAT
jgi:uncharacterized OB-fold protein